MGTVEWQIRRILMEKRVQLRRVLCTGGSGFIGIHLVDCLLEQSGVAVLNIDLNRPSSTRHAERWEKVDILDRSALEAVFSRFDPTHVVHLAAKADMEGKSAADFPVNTTGTSNVLAASRRAPSLERLIVTSTQHVRRPGSGPAAGDDDFQPLGGYGASKAEAERLVREADLSCCWTIIRPTTVWGPGSRGLAAGLWRLMERGVYVHPRGDSVIRSYGYVKNVAFQIRRLMEAPRGLVDGKVLYLGDLCVRQLDWVNAFSQAIEGRPVRTVPAWTLHLLALLGEPIKRLGLRSPLYLSRYRNLVTGNPVPVEDAIAVLGAGPYSSDQGIQETIAWLRSEGWLRVARDG